MSYETNSNAEKETLEKLGAILVGKTSHKLILLAMIVAAFVFSFDLAMPLGVASAVPYVAVVLIGFWLPRPQQIYLLATLGTVLTIVGYILSPDGSPHWALLVNRGLALFAIWITAFLIASRKRAENERDEKVRERDFQKLALDEHAIVSIADIKGNITQVNDKFCDISGFSREELIGQNHRILKSGDHTLEFYEDLWQTISSGKPWHGEIKNRKKGGGNYWVKATIVPFLNEKGRPFQYVAVRTDITERKEAEEEISQLKLALDEHAIVSIADIKGNITLVNDKFCDISGFSREELIGQNHRILKSGDHTLEFYEDLWQTISSGKPWHGEIKNRKKGGGNYWVKATIVPFLNEKGRPFQYVAVRTDITERKEVEEEISQFKTTLDRTHDCIFMFRPDTLRFFYVNQGGMDQVGYTEDELFGMRPFDIKPDFDEQGFREIVQPLIEGPQQSVTFETVHQHRNGDLIPVEIFLQYIAPPDEEARFVAIVRDVSERKIVEKAKSEFVSTVSHELRTPLTSIKGALGLIRAGAIGDLPDKLKSMLDIAYNNSERLVLLINDILDMEKIQSGEMHFNMKPMDATALAKSAIEANQGYGAQHGVTFVLTGMDEEAFVHGDVDRLMQVMSNLMSNAVKFSPAQGSVEISVTRKGDIIRVTVSDKGPGIPENFRRRIFSRFSQADSSDTRQKSGTGLGLSISKAIIEDHGGTIGFDSVEGKGTTFFFELPELKELTETRIAQPVRNDGEKHRILICEDEADIAVILAAMLQSAGYRTSVAGSAAEAKKLLDENQYDAMTLDLDLPDQDGIGLIRELRDNPKTQNLPIIVVSAAAREGEKEINGDAIGVIDWIEKPIEPTDLIDRLNHALTRHSNEKPRVLHVEDDEDILKVVAALVADAATIVMAETIAQAKTLLQNETFDLVILDLLLPDGAGEDLLPLLNKTGHGSTPVIVFSVKEMSADVAKNVHAILVKSQTSNDDLLNTIRSAIQATQSVE